LSRAGCEGVKLSPGPMTGGLGLVGTLGKLGVYAMFIHAAKR